MTDTTQNRTVTIDGRGYDIDYLSDIAKSQIANLRIVDAEIARIERQLKIYKTARAAYARTLSSELPADIPLSN